MNLRTAEAAEKLGVTVTTLEKIEEKGLPSASMFRNMARIYGFPEATLLAESPPTLHPLPTDHRTFDGVVPHLSHETILTIRAVQNRQDALAELSDLGAPVPVPNLKRLQMKSAEAEAMGEAERRRIGIPISEQFQATAQQAFMAWRILIETTGVCVYVEDFPLSDSKGISLYHGSYPAIILNRNERRDAWRLFTLLHEYAHLLIREPGVSDLKHNSRSKTEKFCNRFAASFLMPEAAVDAAMPGRVDDLDIETLADAAARLNVSISAFSLRLEELGRAKKGFYNRIRSVLTPPSPSEKRKATPIPQQYIVLSKLGHAYTSHVLEGIEWGTLNTVQASRLLGTSPRYFEALRDAIVERRAKVRYAV